MIFGQASITTTNYKKMEKFLKILESSRQEQQLFEEEKVKSIWDSFSVSEATYQAYPVDEKTKLFSRYYSGLYEKYYSSGKTFFLFGCACVGSLSIHAGIFLHRAIWFVIYN